MQDSNGQKISGRATIPVADMARENLGKIFPHLSVEQIEAMKAGKPVPPSKDWDGFGKLDTAKAVAIATSIIGSPRNEDDVRRLQELRQQLNDANDALRRKARTEGIFNAVIESMDSVPLLTAILVFGNKHRVRRARKAVNQFIAQSYPNKQLVIVNATDIPITDRPHRQIREVPMEVSSEFPSYTTGSMRNFGMKFSDGEYIYPHWDDDDVYDQHLLTFMMASRKPGKAVLLTSQIRVDIKNSVAYMHVQPDGIPNTMIVPATPYKYPDKTAGDDVAYWGRYWSSKSVIIDNLGFPVNTLKMCVWDGNNATAADQFMVGHDGADLHGKWALGGAEAEVLKDAMASFGLITQPRLPEPAQDAPTAEAIMTG